MTDDGIIREITSVLYSTSVLYPIGEPRRRKKMARDGGVIHEDGLTKFLSEYCEIPAQGNPISISGRQAELYKTVLESLGYSTKLEKFTIDSRGDSPELREELGKNYLDNRVILVSESQTKRLSLLEGNQPYMHNIANQIVNDSGELVKKITLHEALTGNVNILYGSTSIIGAFDTDFKDYSSSNGLLHVVLPLDTLAGSVKKINFLNNKISFITESSLKSLTKDLLANILTDIHPLTTKYGSIETIKNSSIIDLPLDEEILYFKHKGRDIFFFNKHTPNLFLVYKGDKIEHKLPFEVLHSSEKSKIIDYLVKNGFLKVEKENIFKNLESMAKSFLGEQVKDCSELTGFHFYKIFKKYKDQPGISGRLKETDWYLLRDVCYGNIEFGSLPLQLKEIVTSPRDETVKTYIDLLNQKISKP